MSLKEKIKAAVYLLMIAMFPLPVILLKGVVALCVACGVAIRFNWELLCLVTNIVHLMSKIG